MPASKEYFRQYYLTRKRKLFVVVGGEEYSCAQCSYQGDDLQFDHVDPSIKSFTIGARIMQSWRPERYAELLAELKKCQLLCPDHHLAKTVREQSVERGWEHGTWYGFIKKRCTCDLCSARRDKYNEQRRANRGAVSRGPYGLPAEHGTYKRYKRGCKCAPCKGANAERAREIRKNKPVYAKG